MICDPGCDAIELTRLNKDELKELLNNPQVADRLKDMGSQKLLRNIRSLSEWRFVLWTLLVSIAVGTGFIYGLLIGMSGNFVGIIVAILCFVALAVFLLPQMQYEISWYHRYIAEYSQFKLCLKHGLIIEPSGTTTSIVYFNHRLLSLTRPQ